MYTQTLAEEGTSVSSSKNIISAMVEKEDLTGEDLRKLDEINNNINFKSKLNETGVSGVDENVQSMADELLLATTTDEENPLGVTFEKTYLTSPLVHMTENESVSPLTGELKYEKTLMSLPGRNGLDFNLSVSYSTLNATQDDQDNRYKDSSFYTDMYRETEIVEIYEFVEGWEFNLPKIFGKYIRLYNGETYEMQGSTLINYPNGDINISKGDVNEDTVVSFLNGRTETYDGSLGYIKKIEDRFGNEINFEYTDFDYSMISLYDYYYNVNYTAENKKLLTKITDSVGREIIIKYNYVNYHDSTYFDNIKIMVDEEVYAEIVLENTKNHNGAEKKVTQIIDAENLKTNFEYELVLLNYYNFNIHFHSFYAMVFFDVYASTIFLKRIEYPTGAWSEYEYEKTRIYGSSYQSDYWNEGLKTKKRTDSSGDVTMYKYINDRATEITLNGVSQRCTYDSKRNLISKEIYEGSKYISPKPFRKD